MSKLNQIKIEIQDRVDNEFWVELDRWESYSITSNIFQPCDNFVLSPTPGLYSQFRAGNQKIRILCDGVLQFTGKTDEISSRSNPQRESLEISGRDMAAFLVDAACEPFCLTGLTLKRLAEKLTEPYRKWIPKVLTDNAPNFYKLIGRKSSYKENKVQVWNAALQKSIEKVSKTRVKGIEGGKESPYYRGVDQDSFHSCWADGGERIYEILQKHAERVACAMWMTVDGSLFIGRPRYEEQIHEPSLKYLKNGKGNILSSTLTLSTSERFSHWKFLAQGSGRKAARGSEIINHSISVTDPGSAFWLTNDDGANVNHLYMPTTIRVSGGCQDEKLLRRLARTSMEKSILQTYNYEVVVAGHYSDNDLFWTPDCCVDVIDEKHNIKGVHYIVGRTFELGIDSKPITRLKLIPTGIWLALDHDEITDGEYAQYMRNKIWW